MIHDEFPHQIVEMFGGHAGLHFRHQHIEAFSHETSRLAHTCEAFGIVNANFARAHRQQEGSVSHQSGPFRGGNTCICPLDSNLPG